MNNLAEAIRIVGGVGKMAAGLGIAQGAVSNWKKRGGGVPLEHCATIERLTGGKVTAEQLREGCWIRVPDPDWPHPQGRPVLDFGKTRPPAPPKAPVSASNKPDALVPRSCAAMNDVVAKVA